MNATYHYDVHDAKLIVHVERYPERIEVIKPFVYGVPREEAHVYLPLRKAKRVIVGDGVVGHCECGECHTHINARDVYCRTCGAELEGRW